MEPSLLPVAALPGLSSEVPSGVPLLGSVAASRTTLSFFPRALDPLRSRDSSWISLRIDGLLPAGIVLERKIQAVLRQRSQR